MALSEKENIYNVQELFVINPEQICALAEIKLKKDLPIETQVNTKIYFNYYG